MTTRSSSTTEIQRSVTLIEVKPGVKFPEQLMRDMLPDIETLLFFCKLYELNHVQVSALLKTLFQTSLVDALTSGDHSTDLQDYLVDLAYQAPGVNKGDITVAPHVPHGEILPEIWEQLEVVVAQSIKDVAKKLESAIAAMPGKQGVMVFKSLATLNKRRPTLGDYKTIIAHPPRQPNLVILDVSGSMSAGTIRAIIDDVVALSYKADAHMAVVSNTTTHWSPGSYSVDDVLAACEFGGTRYETLEPLFKQDWGTVVTVADYDSSTGAADHLARTGNSHIDEVLDISLVNRPTFLSECVGQFAGKVRPILIGNGPQVLGSNGYQW